MSTDPPQDAAGLLAKKVGENVLSPDEVTEAIMTAKRCAEILLARQETYDLVAKGVLTRKQADCLVKNMEPVLVTPRNKELVEQELGKLQEGLDEGEMVTIPVVDGTIIGEEDDDVEVVMLPEKKQDKRKAVDVLFAKSWMASLRQVELTKNGAKTGATFFGLVIYNIVTEQQKKEKGRKEFPFNGTVLWVPTLQKSVRKIDAANKPTPPTTIDQLKNMMPNDQGVIELWTKSKCDIVKKTYVHMDPVTKKELFSVGINNNSYCPKGSKNLISYDALTLKKYITPAKKGDRSFYDFNMPLSCIPNLNLTLQLFLHRLGMDPLPLEDDELASLDILPPQVSTTVQEGSLQMPVALEQTAVKEGEEGDGKKTDRSVKDGQLKIVVSRLHQNNKEGGKKHVEVDDPASGESSGEECSDMDDDNWSTTTQGKKRKRVITDTEEEEEEMINSQTLDLAPTPAAGGKPNKKVKTAQ